VTVVSVAVELAAAEEVEMSLVLVDEELL